MKDEEFKDYVFKEISYRNIEGEGNLIKAGNATIIGEAKVIIEEDSHEGVKVVLKKDQHDNIKEIKFICTCGETKSVLLDYSDE
ncbi:MAG: hypothetical protein JEY94_18660 [Melioribacteraceae bacterium]|nr:hypothetical protein [Melioribacteraceae bacterium]